MQQFYQVLQLGMPRTALQPPSKPGRPQWDAAEESTAVTYDSRWGEKFTGDERYGRPCRSGFSPTSSPLVGLKPDLRRTQAQRPADTRQRPVGSVQIVAKLLPPVRNNPPPHHCISCKTCAEAGFRANSGFSRPCQRRTMYLFRTSVVEQERATWRKKTLKPTDI